MGKINPILTGYLVPKTMADGSEGTDIVPSNHSMVLLNEKRRKVGKKQVKFTVSTLTNKTIRSVEQNNYYQGVVLEIMAQDLGHIGPGEKDALHEELKSIFLVRRGKLGGWVVGSTTELDTAMFEKYLEAVRMFAMEKFNIRIPLPNEVEVPDTTNEFVKL